MTYIRAAVCFRKSSQKPFERGGSVRRTKVVQEETPTERPKRRSKPALTPEGRENQLIGLAYEAAEQRLRNGTATSQEIVHFLRLGSMYAQLEQDILRSKREKMQAEIEAIHSQKRVEELYANALTAMRSYSISTDED